MRLLVRFRYRVPTRHLEILPLESRIRGHREHVCRLFSGFLPHGLFLARIDAKAEHLQGRRGLSGAPFHPASREQIQRGSKLGHPRRVIIFGRHQADAVAEADAGRALAG